MALFIIADDSRRLGNMARGKGGYSEPVIPSRRNPVRIEDVDHIYTGSRKAARISDFANEDSEDISRRSHQKDRKLLDDITTKLNKLEFDNIKMDRGVSMKTGFRRHLYGKPRPPVEKETKEQRRQDELRYPWDYTADNMFRPTKRKPKNSKERAEQRKKNDRTPMWLKSERIEPTPPKDPYPEHDPFGLYRPREKRERKDYSGCLAAKKYEDMSVREMLANMKAKAAAMPKKRDMARDVDTLMMDLGKPIVRSQPIEYKVIDDFDPDWEYTPDPGLDDRTRSKIRDSRGDLAEFERMLDSKFGRKGLGVGSTAAAGPSSPPPLRAPSRVPPKVDMAASMRQLERELGVDDGDLYGTAPVTVVREPVVRARTAARSSAGRPVVRRRPGSNPPPASRSRGVSNAEIEVLYSDEDEFYDE